MVRVLSPEEVERHRADQDGESSGILADFGGGLVEGFQEDPFVALAIKSIGAIKGIDPNGFEELKRRTKGSTAAQTGRFIGEHGPGLLFGLATYGAGFFAGRAAIQGIAKKVALQDATRTALGTAARTAERKGVRSQLDRVARKSLDRPGVAAQVQGTPVLQAAAERGGAALGIGTGEGTRELARGKSPTEALKTAAIVTALSAGLDTALVGGARLLFPRARTVDIAQHRANFLKKNTEGVSPRDKVVDIVSAQTKKIDEINTELRTVLKTDLQQIELEIEGGLSNAGRLRKILGGKDAEAERVQDLLRTKRAAKTTRKEFERILETEGTVPYVGSGPGTYVGPFGRQLDKMDPTGRMRSNWFTAPEALFGTLGSAANRFLTPIKQALIRSEAQERAVQATFSLTSNAMRRLVGASEREWKKGFGKNLDMAHAWESKGEAGVREYMESIGRGSKTEEAIALWKTRSDSDWQLFQVQGRKIGGKPPADLRELGVAKWITHGSRDVDADTLIAQMVKDKRFTGTELEAREIVRSRGAHLDPDLTSLEGIRTNDPVRNGPLDFNRAGRGTTRDKLDAGLPLNPNVWDSGFQAQRSAVRRINLDPILGGAVNTEKGRLLGGTIDDMVAAVQAEGHNGAKFRTIIDSMVGRTYYNESMRKWATAATSLQVASKLPMAFLANASQPILTATWLGMKPAIKGALALTSKARRQEFSQAMAVHEHIIRGIGRSMDDEGLALSSFEKVADWTLRWTQFNRIERFNRIHGAAATQVMVRDRLARGFHDRLRGTRLDSTRKMFGEIGLDFDVLVRDMREMTPGVFFKSEKFLAMEGNALIQGAQKTQFFPGATRTPAMWRHPLARTLLQFKTFAVGQSRFMRDAVLTEYSNGNVAPLATYLSAAPIAGELVGDARALISGKTRTTNGIARGLENMSYIGGLGLFTDILGQARWGNLEGVLLGPTFGDLLQISEALLSQDMNAIRRIGQNQPAYKMTGFLMGATAGTAETILEYLDSIDSDDDSAVTRVDVGERLTERIRGKR